MARIQYTQEEREQYRKQRTAEFDREVNELVKTWREKPEEIAEYLRFRNQFHSYSVRNTMLIWAQNPNAQFVGSFKRFKELGYNIRAGEHGMGIMAYTPIIYYRLKTDAAWHRLAGAPQDVKDMVAAGMLETREEPHFKVGTVFDISQTDCPLEDYPKLLGLGYESEQHAAIYKAVCAYSENIGFPVTETNLKSVTLRGDYDPKSHAIRINSLLGDTQKLSTLLHEMAHGILDHKIGEKSTAQRELEADLLSVMLCNRYGIPTTDARKDHLVNSFKMFEKEQANEETPIQLVTLIESVDRLYEQHETSLQKVMESNGIQPKESDKEKSPVVQEKKTGSERWKQVQFAVSEIKNRISIMEVMQRSLSFTKSGENFSCCCPFHEEKTPSFFVNPKTNTYHCFGCGESGDVIDFTKKYYGLDFVSAVAKLDKDCGLHILDEEITEQKAAEIDNYQKKRSEEREKKEQQDQEYAQLQDKVAELDKKLMAIHLTENSPIQELEDYFSLKSSYDAAVGELERLELLRYMERKGITQKFSGNQNSEEQNTRMKIKVECKPLEQTNQSPEGRNHIGDSVITINDSVRFPVKVMENQYGSRYIQMHVYSDKKYSYVVPRNKEIFGNWSNAVLSAYSSETTTEKVVGVGNTGEMTASVRSLRLTESGKIKAYAAIDIGELLTINSIRIIENENGQKYVAFPSLASIKGTEGQVVYPPAVSIINQELETEIKDQVLKKYTQKLQERQEEKITGINKGVKHFCEFQIGRDSGSFEISK